MAKASTRTTKKSTTSKAKKKATTSKAAKKKAPTKKKATKKAGSSKKASSSKKTAAKKTSTKKAASTSTTTKKTSAKKKTTTSKAASSKAGKSKAGKAKAPRKRRRAKLDKFTEGQQEALAEERATYMQQAESLQAEAEQLAEGREPGDVQFDEESGEGDTLAVERERDLALSAQARAAVDEIDAALARIEDGSYGICVSCGSPIPKERLRALPQAALCVRCKAGAIGRP